MMFNEGLSVAPSCSIRVIIILLLVSFIHLCINDNRNMQFLQLSLTVITSWCCVYSSRPVAPSAVTLHRLLTAIAHRYIAVECIVRVYFICIYRLLVISISINAIMLCYCLQIRIYGMAATSIFVGTIMCQLLIEDLFVASVTSNYSTSKFHTSMH